MTGQHVKPSPFEPVREWLKSLDQGDRRVVGQDIKTVELGWPLGRFCCKVLYRHSMLCELTDWKTLYIVVFENFATEPIKQRIFLLIC